MAPCYLPTKTTRSAPSHSPATRKASTPASTNTSPTTDNANPAATSRKRPKRQITPLGPFALESPLPTSQFQNRQFAHEIPSNSLSFAKCVGSRSKPAQGAIQAEADQAILLGDARPFTKASLNLRTSRPFCSMHHAPRPNGARTSALTSAFRSEFRPPLRQTPTINQEQLAT